MKSVLKSFVIMFAATVLFSSCGHMGHHGHVDGKGCGGSQDQTADSKSEQKNEAASKDNKKAECENCKKGS